MEERISISSSLTKIYDEGLVSHEDSCFPVPLKTKEEAREGYKWNSVAVKSTKACLLFAADAA